MCVTDLTHTHTHTHTLSLQTSQKRIVLKECRLLNLSQENIERWHRELELTKRFDHPNLVKAQNLPEGFPYSPRGNTPYICMEYCDGGDLRHVLRDPENVCGLKEVQIRQLCHDISECGEMHVSSK